MRTRLVSLAISLLVVAAGGALPALAAYSTDHAADSPALYGAIILAVREASKWLDRRDATRGGSKP